MKAIVSNGCRNCLPNQGQFCIGNEKDMGPLALEIQTYFTKVPGKSGPK